MTKNRFSVILTSANQYQKSGETAGNPYAFPEQFRMEERKSRMKKTLSLLLSVLLTVSLCLPSMAEGTAEKHVKDYADEIASIQSIFSAGEQALEDGMDPKRVGEEMYGLADANNMLPYFTYACENAVSYETTSYNRLLEFCGRESSQKQIDVTW